jgi:serine/threonine protein kinase
MSLAPGARIGPYEIHAAIGAGRMGEVYGRGTHGSAAPNYPNILAVYEVGRHDATPVSAQAVPYIVAELLEGDALRERLGGGAMPVRKAIEYGVRIAKGLAAAHDRGIVHRDLKPENIFVTADERVNRVSPRQHKCRSEPSPALAGGNSCMFGGCVGVEAAIL